MYKIERPIKCEYCNQVLNQMRLNQLHFECSLCGAEFTGLKNSKPPVKAIIPFHSYDLIPIANTEIAILSDKGEDVIIHKGQKIDAEKYILIEE